MHVSLCVRGGGTFLGGAGFFQRELMENIPIKPDRKVCPKTSFSGFPHIPTRFRPPSFPSVKFEKWPCLSSLEQELAIRERSLIMGRRGGGASQV